MRSKRLITIVTVAVMGAAILAPMGHSKTKNVVLLSGGTSISTTVNNNGNNNQTTVNNTVNNGTPAVTPENNQTTTPASSKAGYKAGQVIVTLGANLTSAQRQQMLNDFGVTEGQSGVKFVNTTNRDIAIELGMDPNHIYAGSQSISSCKVTLLPKGSGISVSTNNLTEVTGDMLASALTTCGITDASIVANAPYAVTGQAALAGILQGFQDVTGAVIPEQNKVVANQEVNVTTSLGNQIGQTKAETVVTQVKKDVVDQQPTTQIQINNIINNVTNNNNIQLTPAQEQQLSNLMVQISKLNLNKSEVNNTLNQIQGSIKKGEKDFSNVSKSISNEYNKLKSEGVFTKIENFFKGLWHEVETFFDGGTKAVENQQAQTTQNNTTANQQDTQNNNTGSQQTQQATQNNASGNQQTQNATNNNTAQSNN